MTSKKLTDKSAREIFAPDAGSTRIDAEERSSATSQHEFSQRELSQHDFHHQDIAQEDFPFSYVGVNITNDIVEDVEQLRHAKHRNKRRAASIDFLRREYNGIYLIDLIQDSFEDFSINEGNSELPSNADAHKNSYSEHLVSYVSIFVHPADRERVLKEYSIDALRRKLSAHDSFTGTYRRLYNNTFGYEQSRVVRLKNFPDEAILAVRDVSAEVSDDNRQMALLQDALTLAQRSNAEKTSFLSNMSHDIRTPMNSIIGFSDIALKHLDDPERVKDCLEKISMSSNHLLNLINDVLDVSRIESGRVLLEEKPLDIVNLMRDLASIFQAQVEQRKIAFTVDYTDIKDSAVYGDALRLNQILINIVGNAVKFTSSGGSIAVSVRQKPITQTGFGSYEFTCKDTGRGMSAGFLDRLFEPFEREHLSHETIEGTGLGLSITKHLVDMMGGTISVESELGRGSTFTVDLMLKRARTGVASTNGNRGNATESIDDLTSTTAGERVLVVDDDGLSREIVSELLKEHHFLVEEASNGREALDMVAASEEGYYDFILMDVRMPQMNGYEATRAIRDLKRDDVATIPIIATTADAFEEDRQKALASGMTAHLSKPLNIHDLLSILRGRVIA